MNNKELEIERTLVLSTAHITENDNILLSELSSTDAYVYGYEHGYQIYVGDIRTIRDHKAWLSLSRMFWKLVILTIRNKCTYLKLDCDARIVPGLQTSDW